MRLSTISSTEIPADLRFDAKFHLSRQNPLIRKLRSGQWQLKEIGATFGRENIWTGNIFARVYAEDPSFGKPLLVPYDLFRYVPWSDKILSRTQVDQFQRLEIKRGWLFIVCSGRNLGPVTIADRFCEQFTMSHDMVRIAVEPSDELFYVAAFLSTAHGQAVIRTDMNGSVIDHTDANQVAAINFPVVRHELREAAAKGFRHGFETREEARILLANTLARFVDTFGLNLDVLPSSARQRRFTIERSAIADRFDAEPFAPAYAFWRRQIKRSGGVQLVEIADVFKPSGRNKTNYVEDEKYGIRMMNGRQIAHYRPIALKFMSHHALRDIDDFSLVKGMTLLTADGRAEENLADCALVESDRVGWAASVHVHRVVPKAGIHPGVVYLACACPPVQAQLKALATGSVVDALSSADVGSVVVPYAESAALRRLGDDASRAWQLFAKATASEDAAIQMLEAEFGC